MRTDVRRFIPRSIKIQLIQSVLIKMVDSEDIIRSVKKCRAIWDLDHEGYHNKQLKDDAWNSVCLELVNDWTHLPGGEKYVRQLELKKRWNNIRDYYKKLLSDTRPGEQEVRAKKRRYLYSDILEFIRPVYDKKQLESTNSNDSISVGENKNDDHQDSENEAQEVQTVTGPKRKCIDQTRPQSHQNRPHTIKNESMTVFEQTIIRTLENKMVKEDDPDLLFLKSLLPDMKKMKKKQKVDFKIGIMELYRNILNGNQLTNDDHDDPLVKVETVRLEEDDDSYHSLQFSDD